MAGSQVHAEQDHRGAPVVSAEVCLAAGDATFLIAGAFGLERLSAHTRRRAVRYRTAAFAYVADLDHWLCPEGEQPWPHELDRERRMVRYRGRTGLQHLPRQASLHRLDGRA